MDKMNLKTEKDKSKQLQDKCQSVLNSLLRDEDNKYCVDCDSKGPRWASWNIGVFLCIRCAGIHRNLGVHISKVKSVNLDAWTPEQVVSLQQMGNSRARAVYEANLPDNFRRPQNDSSLESFIRAKYEHKKYIAREWVPPTLPKVNWEKEIDDEIEKQKRKKKTIIEKRPVNNVEVPQLPKPKNPSPKQGRNTIVDNKNNKDNDLLGLQNGDDNFSGFLSAATTTSTTITTTNPSTDEKKKLENDQIKSEEESFFNQTVPTEKEKVKLTKDSILALYGNTPTNFNQFQSTSMTYQNNFTVPQSNNYQFGSGFPQMSQNFNGYTTGSQWGTTTNKNQQFLPQQNQIQPQLPNQFQNPNNTNFQTNNQFSITNQQYSTGFMASNTNQTQNFVTPTPNPFYNQNLTQQFTNLTMNNSAGTNSTIATATNIWQ